MDWLMRDGFHGLRRWMHRRSWRPGCRGRLRLALSSPVAPGPYPAVPETIRADWESFDALDDEERELVVGELGAWETTLSASQRAGFRLEALVTIMEAYGIEAGMEWGLLTGDPDAALDMRRFLEAICIRVLSEVAPRPIEEIGVAIPVAVHFEYVRGVREILMEEMWRDGGAFATPSHSGPAQ